MKTIGSQKREILADTEYTLILLNGNAAFLLNNSTNKKELWQQNDHFAGYVIEIDGIGYEFITTVKEKTHGKTR